MSYAQAVDALQAWMGRDVVVRLEPEGTVMRGALSELDAAGVDGALYAVGAPRRTGVAFALFRDAVGAVRAAPGELVIEQGRMTVTVTPAG